MTFYSIVPQHKDPIHWDDSFNEEVLRTASDNEMNVYERVDKNLFGNFDHIVLRSPIHELPQDFIPASRIYGDFYIYDLPPLDPVRYSTFKRMLTSIFPQATQVKYKPVDNLKWNGIACMQPKNVISIEKIEGLCVYFDSCKTVMNKLTRTNYLSNEDLRSFEDIIKTITIPQILEKLNIKNETRYVESIGQVVDLLGKPPFGNSLVYTHTYFKNNLTSMKEFFRDNFSIPFVIQTNEQGVTMLADDSYLINSYENLEAGGLSYSIEGQVITDFIIKVKYHMIFPDGGVKPIIDLIGQTGNAVDIEFPLTFQKNSFKAKLAHYGSFHYFGGDAGITTLHTAVATCDAPKIYSLIGFGFHDHIYACDNFVWDMKKDIWYERRGDFYYNSEQKTGFMVIDEKGKLLITNMRAPRLFKSEQKVTTKECLDFFKPLYKDDQGLLIFFYILGMIYAGRFYEVPTVKFPYLFLTGIRAGGKSSLSDLIKRVYNYEDIKGAQTNYEINPFPLTYQCTYRKGIPIFLTEFNEGGNTPVAMAKAKMLIAMYDRTNTEKGTQNQDIISYPLAAMGVIDGEELPKRGALRSRSIICEINMKNNAFGIDEYREFIKNKLPEHLFYSALTKPDINYERYAKYVSYALKRLKDLQPQSLARMVEGYAHVYAGVMMFDEALSDEAIRVLSYKIQTAQVEEEETTGVGELLDYVRKHARQLELNHVFEFDALRREFLISVDDLAAYADMRRHVFSLNFDSLAKYFPNLEDREINGGIRLCAVYPIDDTIPRQLMFHPEVYKLWKSVTGKTLFP